MVGARERQVQQEGYCVTMIVSACVCERDSVLTHMYGMHETNADHKCSSVECVICMAAENVYAWLRNQMQQKPHTNLRSQTPQASLHVSTADCCAMKSADHL
jgi:hypothetical protein